MTTVVTENLILGAAIKEIKSDIKQKTELLKTVEMIAASDRMFVLNNDENEIKPWAYENSVVYRIITVPYLVTSALTLSYIEFKDIKHALLYKERFGVLGDFGGTE